MGARGVSGVVVAWVLFAAACAPTGGAPGVAPPAAVGGKPLIAISGGRFETGASRSELTYVIDPARNLCFAVTEHLDAGAGGPIGQTQIDCCTLRKAVPASEHAWSEALPCGDTPSRSTSSPRDRRSARSKAAATRDIVLLLETYRDDACACAPHDAECAKVATEHYTAAATAWARDHAGDTATFGGEVDPHVAEVAKAAADCIQRAMTPIP